MNRELLFYTVLILSVGILIYIQSRFTTTTDTGYTRIIDLKPFKKMHIDVDYPVYVSRGEHARIAIEGPSNRVENITLEWNNGELTIGMKGQGFLSGLLSMFSEADEEVSVYIRLPKPALIDAPCAANIITNEDIPGLDSCRHIAAQSKFSGYMMDPVDQPFTWLIHAAKKFNRVRLFQMNFNLN